MHYMKNILVLIDGSEPSLRAIKQAFKYAQLVDEATVHIVNVQIAITPRRAARFFSQEALDEYYSEEGRLVMEKAKDLIVEAPGKVQKRNVVRRIEEREQHYNR